MQIDITVSGANFEADLKRFGKKAIAAYARGVQIAGARYRDYLKSMRPVSVKTSGYSARGMPTDTGRMKNSMRSRRLKKLAVGVGPSVGGGRRGSKYPFYVHEGTSKMKARPYMKWALEMGAHKVINRTMKNVSNQLRNL